MKKNDMGFKVLDIDLRDMYGSFKIDNGYTPKMITESKKSNLRVIKGGRKAC